MFANRHHQVLRSAIVQEEDTLSQAPERRGTELVRFGLALADSVVRLDPFDEA